MIPNLHLNLLFFNDFLLFFDKTTAKRDLARDKL